MSCHIINSEHWYEVIFCFGHMPLHHNCSFMTAHIVGQVMVVFPWLPHPSLWDLCCKYSLVDSFYHLFWFARVVVNYGLLFTISNCWEMLMCIWSHILKKILCKGLMSNLLPKDQGGRSIVHYPDFCVLYSVNRYCPQLTLNLALFESVGHVTSKSLCPRCDQWKI